MRRSIFVLAMAVSITAAFQPDTAAGAPPASCGDKKTTRYLASAAPSRMRCLNDVVRVSRSKLNYYANHRWQLAPRYDKWWHVPGSERRKVAREARFIVRLHTKLLAESKARLNRLRLVSRLTKDFDCIHRYEGAWNANTGNSYYGGLQMNLEFQKSYGPEFLARWGTADKWPIWAQLQTAARAYASGRGFGPWPNTARTCGLSTARVAFISLDI